MTTIVDNKPVVRMRRLRQSPALRDLVAETNVSVSDFIQPLFIKAGQGICADIATLPGQRHYSVDQLDAPIKALSALGIPAVILFGIPDVKDAEGSAAWQADGVIQRAVARIKQIAPELVVIADLCCCEYTDHGHCGVLTSVAGQCDVDNDATLLLLQKQALSLAEAGVDMLAPSGMMDGMVHAVREVLDINGYQTLPILSYAVKYASSFYGPFRGATEGSFSGSRVTYQMNPANAERALREAQLDVDEGADMLMVKPAGQYLDIIHRVKSAFPAMPLAAYQVSGEYAMIKAAAQQGWLDEPRAVMESLLAIKRAGADCIITYYAEYAAQLLQR